MIGGFWAGLFVVGAVLAVLVYVMARRIGILALVDLIWTAGLGLAALVYFLLLEARGVRSWVILAIVLAWSLRLSFHLLRDRVLQGKEDPRYQNLKEYWGVRWRRNFLGLFLVQVPFVALFMFPISIALDNTRPWHWNDWAALSIALLAVVGEWLADRQLAAFRRDPDRHSGVCRDGLWRYSRHPNYFFEWVHWWVYPVMAIGAGNAWLALVGPLAMYVFLRFLTGVPPAERSSLKRRGDAYRQYQATTNAFFPWKPQKTHS